MKALATRWNPHLLGSTLVSFALWLAWFQIHGVWWTPDTMTYLTVADALREGSLSTGLHYRPYTDPYPVLMGWPPAYPALLAVLLSLGCSDSTATLLVSAGCFVLVQALVGWWLQQVGSRTEASWLSVGLVGLAPWLEISLRGWSEGPWTVLFMALVICLCRDTTSRSHGLCMGVGSGGLLLVRHSAALTLPLTLAYGWWRWRDLRSTGWMLAGQCATAGMWVLASVGYTGRLGYAYAGEGDAIESVCLNLGWALYHSGVESVLAVGSRWPWWTLLLGVVGLTAFVGPRHRPHRFRSVTVWMVLTGVLALAAYVRVRGAHYLDEPDGRIVFPLMLPLMLAALGWAACWASPIRLRVLIAGLTVFAWTVVVDAWIEPKAPYDWVTTPRFDRRMAWIEDHTSPDTLVLGPMSVVTHYRTGRPSLGVLDPPYGDVFTAEEFEYVSLNWPGPVVFVVSDWRRASARENSEWLVSDHPLVRRIHEGKGYTVWSVPRP